MQEEEQKESEKEVKEQAEEVPDKVWDEQKRPLKDDEELEFDSSAYETLHRSKVEWPCLSLDVLVRERCGNTNWFPNQVIDPLNQDNSYFNEKI